MKYKILILSNKDNEEIIEDIYLKERFKKDGNICDIKWVDYDEKLDDYYDVIIRRNTWVGNGKDTVSFQKLDNSLIDRLKSKNIKTVNLLGLDGSGKEYLMEFYHKNLKVIPTTDDIDEALSWNKSEYVLKEKDSFGSSIGQAYVLKDELKEKFNKDKYLIQPKLKFKSEVQTYFINSKLMYAFEYIPSKYPVYPDPIYIKLSKEEEKLATLFSSLSNIKYGMKRVDFLRLEDNSLVLLEIEDNAPHMSLEELDEKYRNKVIDEYVKGIYEFIEK